MLDIYSVQVGNEVRVVNMKYCLKVVEFLSCCCKVDLISQRG